MEHFFEDKWNCTVGVMQLPRTISKRLALARLATQRGCRAGASKQRPIATVQGYGRYSGPTFDYSQFPFSHLRFHN